MVLYQDGELQIRNKNVKARVILSLYLLLLVSLFSFHIKKALDLSRNVNRWNRDSEDGYMPGLEQTPSIYECVCISFFELVTLMIMITIHNNDAC